MSDSVVRVGFVGASSISRKVWAAIEAAGHLQVTCVGSRTAERARDYIKASVESLHISEQRVPAAATYEEVVSSPDVDVVYISLPVTARNEWVLKCAQNGKHVVGEKPPAASTEQLQEWLKALGEHRLLYMDGTMFSHGPYVKSVVEAIPKVGTVRHMAATLTFCAPPERVQADIRMKPELEPLGAIGDTGWYCVRSFLHMMNFAMPVAVAGRVIEKLPNGAIMSFKGDLTFTDPKTNEPIYATFYCGFTSSPEQDFIISGTKGTIDAPHLTNPLTDVGPAKFEIITPSVVEGGIDVKVIRHVDVVEIPEECGHAQETEMWRCVHRSLQRGKDGRLVADETAAQEWGKRAWITQCVLEKLLESSKSQ